MLNIANILDFSAKEYMNKTAVILGDKAFTYAQINAAANQVAHGLQAAGIGKDDKVVISCPNLPFFPMVYYGALKVGAVVVPINVLSKGREIAYYLKDSDAKAIFSFQGTPDLPMAEEAYAGYKEVDSCEHFWIMTADPAAPSPVEGIPTLGQLMANQPSTFETVQTNTEDTAVILYTSGTTGFPKGAELTHSNMTMNALACASIGFKMTHDDVHAVVLPLFHSFGQTGHLNGGFLNGNTLVLIPRFTPEEVLSVMQKHNVSFFAGVPTMYWQLLTYEDKENRLDMDIITNNLRLCIGGAAPLSVEIINGFEKKFKTPIAEAYGLSETSPGATLTHLHKKRKIGSAGTPFWGIGIKVVDESDKEVPTGEVGEILISGHNVMKGYYNNPKATAEAFKGTTWFHSGDLGIMDEDGDLFIVDRVNDMIIRGGFNIYPRELEEVLITHPKVSLVAVIGVPHEKYGEEVKAYIILNEREEATAEEIIAWAKEQMAAYKYPRIVEIVKELPMTATGKILKKELRATVSKV